MHIFYFNIPWIIDEAEYYCSSRTLTHWKARGSTNGLQEAYFLISGVVFVTMYTLSLIGMINGKLLRIPCYRLMFFNGFIDIADLSVGSLAASYLHYTGGVFCSNVALNQILGHLCWSLWIGSTFICIALAFNRVVEMIPSMEVLRFLFQGRAIYVWMIVCVSLMILRAFVTRPLPYNSSVSAFLGAPFISDDMQWEIGYYTSLLLPIHNFSVVFIVVMLYAVLCYKVSKMSSIGQGKTDKIQIQISAQALIVCSTTATTAVLYLVVEFIPVPKVVVILTNVAWQLGYGSHSLVYIFLNKTIRRGVLGLFGFYQRSQVFVAPAST